MIYNILPYIEDYDAAYSFLKEKKVLNSVAPQCSICQKEMTLIKQKEGKIFRCPKHKAIKESIKKFSFLENSKLRLQDFILLSYLWSQNIAVHPSSEMTGLSKSTVVQWYQYMRDITSNYLVRNPYQIGGLGHIVEIDEPKMCKQKCNRGRTSQERWVFGGWDRKDKKGFLVFVPDHSSETLLPLFRRYIKPGTIIYSNCWSAYNGISEIDVTPKYTHFKVNQTENFVDPNVHTDSVKCYWKNAKRHFKHMMGEQTDMIESYLDEFLWREQYGKTGNECFENIFKHLSEWFAFK